jgi:adenine phosphoribosyltransferase
MDLREFIRDIPDFPSPGIVFKDITPLLLDARALDGGARERLEPHPVHALIDHQE